MSIILHPDTGIEQAVEILHDGGVLSYPTEAVFGLGCDPLNRSAVIQILALKSRIIRKGLILIAAHFEQLKPYLALDELTPAMINAAIMTWPGPYTWVFPASSFVPSWIRGDFSSIAVRVTKHPVARQICELFGSPIVSTSANIDGFLPAKEYTQVLTQFPNNVDAVVTGEVGQYKAPTQIRDLKTGKILRFG